MTLEHAETVDNPPKISAQSLALVGKMCNKNGPVKLRKQPPALTNTRKDRAMANRADITPELLCQLLRYEPETGKLFWRIRDRMHFPNPARVNSWNSRLANKEAFTSKTLRGYFQGNVLNNLFLAHRVIWAMQTGGWPDGEIDHINHNKADNRYVNLRAISHRDNMKNKATHRNNTSGFNGVWWWKSRQKWCATITVGGQQKYLGLFQTKEAAIEVRKLANIEHGFHTNHGMTL